MNMTDLYPCPKCNSLEVGRILMVHRMCNCCLDKQTYDDIEQLMLTADGTKVYYAFQEELSYHSDHFDNKADGGVWATSTLPPMLNRLAKYLTLTFLCKEVKVCTRDYKKHFDKLGSIWAQQYLNDVFLIRIKGKFNDLYKKYNVIGDIQ